MQSDGMQSDGKQSEQVKNSPSLCLHGHFLTVPFACHYFACIIDDASSMMHAK